MTGNEYYEATQKQRRHERRIRETKREIHAMQIAGLDDTSARLKLGNQQRKLKAYTDRHGLPRLPHREKAYGIGSQPRALRKDPRPKTLMLPDRSSEIMKGMHLKLPDGGAGRVKPDTTFTRVEVFAGRGTSTRFEKAGTFVELHGGTASQWQHSKGYVLVYDEYGVARLGNVHWYEEPTVGIVWPFVKGWSKRS